MQRLYQFFLNNLIDSDRVTNIKNRRIAERNARRTRRKEKRRTVVGEEDVHNDGMSSDDELVPSDESRFAADRGMLDTNLKPIFT